MPGKEKKERNERQRGLPIYPTTILRDLTFTPPGCCCLVAQLCPTLCNPVDCCQAPPSMEFSRREYWSGLPCPPPGNLPNPGTEPRSPALQVDSLSAELQLIHNLIDLIYNFSILHSFSRQLTLSECLYSIQ